MNEPLPIHVTVQPGWDSLLGAYHRLEAEILQKLEKPAEAADLLALAQDLGRAGGLLQRISRDCLYLARKRLEFVGRSPE
jgi:hypothetical protein